MDKTIATANALQRMLLQNLLANRLGLARGQAQGEHCPGPPAEAAETLPMHYRSEAFAEDLVDSYPAGS